MITDFATAIGVQVENSARAFIPTPMEVLEIRRASAGSWALFVLMEYAEEIQLPQEVFDHPAIKQMEDSANDQILITNDMLSYAKEEVRLGRAWQIRAVC